jgi:hypothetical protein
MPDTHPGAWTLAYNCVQRGELPPFWCQGECTSCGHVFRASSQSTLARMFEDHFKPRRASLFSQHVWWRMERKRHERAERDATLVQAILRPRPVTEVDDEDVVVYTQGASIYEPRYLKRAKIKDDEYPYPIPRY